MFSMHARLAARRCRNCAPTCSTSPRRGEPSASGDRQTAGRLSVPKAALRRLRRARRVLLDRIPRVRGRRAGPLSPSNPPRDTARAMSRGERRGRSEAPSVLRGDSKPWIRTDRFPNRWALGPSTRMFAPGLRHALWPWSRPPWLGTLLRNAQCFEAGDRCPHARLTRVSADAPGIVSVRERRSSGLFGHCEPRSGRFLRVFLRDELGSQLRPLSPPGFRSRRCRRRASRDSTARRGPRTGATSEACHERTAL